MATDFAAQATGRSAELSDLAQDNSRAWDCGGSLVKEFVDVICWIKVWICEIQKLDERHEKFWRRLSSAKELQRSGASVIALPRPRTQVPHDLMVWFAPCGRYRGR